MMQREANDHFLEHTDIVLAYYHAMYRNRGYAAFVHYLHSTGQGCKCKRCLKSPVSEIVNAIDHKDKEAREAKQSLVDGRNPSNCTDVELWEQYQMGHFQELCHEEHQIKDCSKLNRIAFGLEAIKEWRNTNWMVSVQMFLATQACSLVTRCLPIQELPRTNIISPEWINFVYNTERASKNV